MLPSWSLWFLMPRQFSVKPRCACKISLARVKVELHILCKVLHLPCLREIAFSLLQGNFKQLVKLIPGTNNNRFRTSSRVSNRAGAVADAFLNYSSFWYSQVLHEWSRFSSSSPFAGVFPTIWNPVTKNVASERNNAMLRTKEGEISKCKLLIRLLVDKNSELNYTDKWFTRLCIQTSARLIWEGNQPQQSQIQ